MGKRFASRFAVTEGVKQVSITHKVEVNHCDEGNSQKLQGHNRLKLGPLRFLGVLPKRLWLRLARLDEVVSGSFGQNDVTCNYCSHSQDKGESTSAKRPGRSSGMMRVLPYEPRRSTLRQEGCLLCSHHMRNLVANLSEFSLQIVHQSSL